MNTSTFRYIGSALFSWRPPAWLGLLLVLSSPALAQQAAPLPQPDPPATLETADAPDTSLKSVEINRNCLAQTRTRIRRPPVPASESCLDPQGRSYDRRDINRTGAVDLSGALRRMDPSITIHDR